MLSLDPQLRVGDFAVFRDRARAGSGSTWTSRFYAVRDTPRLASDSTGRPELHLTWLRRPAGSTEHGGMLVVTTELGPGAEEREEIAAELERRFGDELPAPVEVSNVPFRSGVVELSVAGDSAPGGAVPGELVVGGAGPRPAALTGGQRVSFATELTADGASLVWQMLERGESVLHVGYELVVEYLPADLTLRVWCDAERSYEALASGGPDALSSLVHRRLAGVRIESERPVPAEEMAELTAHGHGVLERVLESAFFDPAPEGGVPALKPWSGPAGGSTGARLDYLLAQSVPLVRELSIGGIVELPTLESLGDRAEKVDLERGFFDVLEVGIVTTADFDGSPIDKIRVAVDYDERSDGGDRVERHGEFLLTGSSPQALFRTELADPARRTIHYRAEVHYDTPVGPLVVEEAGVESSVIVLDVDALGVIDVSGELGHAPPEWISHATVELETLDGAHGHAAILDAGSPSFRWLEATGRADDRLRYSVTWTGTDGTRMETGWLALGSRRLRFDAPQALDRQATVRLLSSGSFDGLAQIVAELETLSEPAGQTAQFAFSAPGEQAEWQPRLTSSDGLRYRLRTTLSFENGELATTPWRESDRHVLAVYDAQRRDVEISARLLDLGGSVVLAILTVEGPDGRGESFVLRAPEDRRSWSYRPEPGGDTGYRYRLTLIPRSGERISTDWIPTEDDLLLPRQPTT